MKSSSSLRKSAMTKRADVLAALADYAAAECALQLEVAKQYPDIHLNPGYEFDAGVNKWAVGFTITPPLLNRNKGPIAEAEAKRAEAAAKLSAAQSKALAEVERAQAGVQAAQGKLEVTGSLLEELGKALTAANQAVKEGAVDRLTAVTAQLEMDAAKVSQLDAKVELQQAIGDLEAATQTSLK
jgi:outer membrane protein, heavy metal efflux system